MPAWLTQEVLYAYSVPMFVIVILVEMFYSHRSELKLYRTGDVLKNLYFAIINIGLDLVMKVFSFIMLGWAYQYRIITIENVWLYWIALVLLQDFAYYVHHFVDHHCRFFWAVHITHHSSELFNITTGFRSPVLQPLYRYFYFMPVALLGFEPLHIMFAYAATQIYGTLIHTQTIRRMGVFEYFMVTPSHHRVHHGSNVAYLDRNMGMFLIVWDKLFGTFQKEKDAEPVRFGIVTPLTEEQARHPMTTITHEFEAIWQDATQANLTPMQRLKYIFAAPGWSHDGSKMTSKQMQDRAQAG
ncbi:MAG: sterol desaturase family protein [Formosimonas sp.]|jgi:sterol desaturase/sphingolipid hydroxylase (fatty acid hydroxylase superfamily)